MTLTVTQWLLVAISLSTTIGTWTGCYLIWRNRRDHEAQPYTPEELEDLERHIASR